LKRKFEVVAGQCIARYLKRAHCERDVIIARISRGTFLALAAIFLLALDYTYTAVGWEQVFISELPCTNICRTAEYRNASRSSENLLVLIQLDAVRKDNQFVSLWCHGAFIIPMALAMYHSVEVFTK